MQYFRLFIGLITACAFTTLSAQQQYSKVKIDLTETSIHTIAQLGLEHDHGLYAPGKHLINDYSANEVARLQEAGVAFEVLIEDVVTWYQAHSVSEYFPSAQVRDDHCGNGGEQSFPGAQYVTPANYANGTMGGYLRYQELLEQLDQMAALYPDLITPRDTIGDIMTYEGRPIYWMTISDNPNVDEDEPEIMYTALHHAREANSLAQLIFYMWYLLENYETDERVQYLVNNTQMYFIPCVNPDGYIYNETIEPNGGGLWHKNRFDNGDGTFGVDLNRNYGYLWGNDNQGSSPSMESDVYRGAGPFSEAETQAVRLFLEDKDIEIAINAHTFGNLLIRPILDDPTDLATYLNFGEILVRENNFTFGDDLETVGYSVNGDSDSWMYHEQMEKPKIFALTPEIGSAFWPNENDIIPLNKSVMSQNLIAANLLLDYLEVTDMTPQALPDVTGNLIFSGKQYGLRPGDNTITATAISDNFTITTPAQMVNPTTGASANIAFDYTITPTVGNVEEALVFSISIDNGLYTRVDTFTKTFINVVPETILFDEGNDLSNWTTSDDWNITNEDAWSPTTSITDRPFQRYANNSNTTIVLNETIDLTNAELARISYRAKWEIEANYDYVQIEAQTANSNEWVPLCGQFTNTGVADQGAADGQPLYDGIQNEWVAETINLDDFLGEAINIRFQLVSDQFVRGDGFFFDDFRIDAYSNTVSSNELKLPKTQLLVYPNPAFDEVTAELTFDEPANDIQIQLTNAIGQIVQTQYVAQFIAGRHRLPITVANLAEGLYFLTVVAEGKVVGSEGVIVK